MIGCAEAYRKRIFGENRAVNTKKHKDMQKTAKTEILVYWKHEHYFSMQAALHFSQYWNDIADAAVWQSPKCVRGVSFSINATHSGCKKETRKTETNYIGSCCIFPSKERLSDVVGWLYGSKMLCSTCSLIMPYFRSIEQVDYVLKATRSKEFRKNLLNHFSKCLYQTVLGQILPFSLNSLSPSISLLLLNLFINKI